MIRRVVLVRDRKSQEPSVIQEAARIQTAMASLPLLRRLLVMSALHPRWVCAGRLLSNCYSDTTCPPFTPALAFCFSGNFTRRHLQTSLYLPPLAANLLKVLSTLQWQKL